MDICGRTVYFNFIWDNHWPGAWLTGWCVDCNDRSLREMNSPADAAKSNQAKKVCKAQAWSFQRESCWGKKQDQGSKNTGEFIRLPNVWLNVFTDRQTEVQGAEDTQMLTLTNRQLWKRWRWSFVANTKLLQVGENCVELVYSWCNW